MSILFKIVLTAFLITTPPYFVSAFLYEYHTAEWIEKIAGAIMVIWCCLLALVICGGLYFIIQWIWTL